MVDAFEVPEFEFAAVRVVQIDVLCVLLRYAHSLTSERMSRKPSTHDSNVPFKFPNVESA